MSFDARGWRKWSMLVCARSRSLPSSAAPQTRDGSGRSTCCVIQPGTAHWAFGRVLRTPICCTSARNASRTGDAESFSQTRSKRVIGRSCKER
jgi:hypothetical protein